MSKGATVALVVGGVAVVGGVVYLVASSKSTTRKKVSAAPTNAWDVLGRLVSTVGGSIVSQLGNGRGAGGGNVTQVLDKGTGLMLDPDDTSHDSILD